MGIFICLAGFCRNPDQERLIQPPQKILTDLPLEILRKIVEPLGIKDRCQARLSCQQLAEAVSTVKWPRREVEITIRIESIPSARKLSRIIRRSCQSQSPSPKEGPLESPKDQEYDVHVNLSDLSLRADWSKNFKLCKTISTTYLTIFGGPLDDDKLRYVNGLLDVCEFGNLSLKLAPGQRLTERAYNLISRAKNSVCLYAYDNDISVDEYKKLSDPSTMNSSCKNTYNRGQLYMISDQRCVSRTEEMRRPFSASRPPSCFCVHTIGDPDPGQLSHFTNCRHWQRWQRPSQQKYYLG